MSELDLCRYCGSDASCCGEVLCREPLHKCWGNRYCVSPGPAYHNRHDRRCHYYSVDFPPPGVEAA